jgi:hypothetical protein
MNWQWNFEAGVGSSIIAERGLGCVGTKRHGRPTQPVFLSHSSDDPSLAFGFITSLLLRTVLTAAPSGLNFYH